MAKLPLTTCCIARLAQRPYGREWGGLYRLLMIGVQLLLFDLLSIGGRGCAQIHWHGSSLVLAMSIFANYVQYIIGVCVTCACPCLPFVFEAPQCGMRLLAGRCTADDFGTISDTTIQALVRSCPPYARRMRGSIPHRPYARGKCSTWFVWWHLRSPDCLRAESSMQGPRAHNTRARSIRVPHSISPTTTVVPCHAQRLPGGSVRCLMILHCVCRILPHSSARPLASAH